MLPPVKSNGHIGLALLMMGVFIATRWPGLMPPNFSAAYGLLFCGGVYFRNRLAWWMPLAAMAVSDIGITFYYWKVHHIPFHWYPLVNYAAYGVLIALGRRCRPEMPWWKLLGGGVVGALLFYLITNTASWLLNPFGNTEYTRDWVGWLTALTQGTAGHPPTWEFLRNTLSSGGLFTGLFAGAMKLADHLESAAEKEAAEAPEESDEEAPSSPPNPQPEEARA